MLRCVLLSWALTVLAMGFQAEATTVVAFQFDTLCKQAVTIAYVRCEKSESFQDSEVIFTRTQLTVLQRVKGLSNEQIVLILPGGQVGDQRLVVHGMPRFVAGQEMVVFLSEKGERGSAWPVGLGQGCYGVRQAQDGARQVLLQHGPVPEGVRAKPAQTPNLPLQDFIKQVHQVLKSEGQD